MGWWSSSVAAAIIIVIVGVAGLHAERGPPNRLHPRRCRAAVAAAAAASPREQLCTVPSQDKDSWRRLANSSDAAMCTLMDWAVHDPAIGFALRDLAVLRGRKGGNVVAEEWPRALRSRVGTALKELESSTAARSAVLRDLEATETEFERTFRDLHQRRRRVSAVVANVNEAVAELAGPWAYNLGLLEAYVEEARPSGGTDEEAEAEAPALPPISFRSPCGVALGKWLADQRRAAKTGRLSATRLELLAPLRALESPRDRAWRRNLEALKDFTKKYGHADVPRAYRTASESSESSEKKKKKKKKTVLLGAWVHEQRLAFRARTLAEDRKRLLEEAGLRLLPRRDEAWDRHFALLVTRVRAGHSANVPARCVCQGANLGAWTSVQRRAYKNHRLDPSRAAKLEALGFAWDARDATWLAHRASLADYVKRNGHARLPRRLVLNSQRLGDWLARQKQLRKAGTLPPDRLKALDAIIAPPLAWTTTDDDPADHAET